jgi:hypothetical protein
LSSVSNTYRSKSAVDTAVNAVYRMGMQDNKFAESQVSFTTTSMAQAKDAIKKDKQNQMESEVVLNNDSRKNKFINRISHPTKALGSKAMNVNHFTQKQKFQVLNVQTHLKPQNGNNQVKLGERETVKLINQVYGDHNKMSIPKKDHLKIIRNIKRDEKLNHIGNEGFATRYSANTKALSKAFTHRVDQYREKNGKNNAEVIQENTHYTQAGLHKPEDRVSNVRTTESKFHPSVERLASNPAGKTTKVVPINMSNYEFDTDPTTDNAYMTRRNGAQKMGYIFNERIYDNDISPVSEVINTRRYITNTK